MKIYNSFSRKKENFEPIKKGEVSMYVCGPTVYGPPHIGHARSYINFDVVARFFRFLGLRVNYVQNITDVGHLVGDGDEGEDKISKQARAEKVDPYKIARKYEEIFFDAMGKLNVEKATHHPRATEYIAEMIDMAEVLIKKGYAYATKSGNVYFDVRSFENYGKLSGRKLNEGKSGERIELADDKKNPEDFALWKAADKTHLMQWDSPWGMGYPGWHIECSAMSKKLLGETIDIHGGGLDNMFPHHECEVMQSEAYTGKEFAKFFMHNNLVNTNGTKMGKSLGNAFTLDDLFEKFSPEVLRFFILKFHYRSVIDFNLEALELAEREYNKIANKLKIQNSKLKTVDKLTAAMKDDFNTPVVIAELLGLKEIDENTLDFCKRVLGLKFEIAGRQAAAPYDIPQEIKNLAEKRMEAKKNKDWAKADEIRNKIAKAGYIIVDTKDGYEVKKA